MRRNSISYLSLLFILFSLSVQPIASHVIQWPSFSSSSTDSCEIICPAQMSSHWAYETGSVYIYNYSVSALTSMVPISEKTSELGFEAQLSLEVLSSCEMELKIVNVRLNSVTNSEDFISELTRNTVKFSFIGGVIKELCAVSIESSATLNIKRGILSFFQQTLTDFDAIQRTTETDVFGICETEYVPNPRISKDTITYKKRKNGALCRQHQRLKWNLWNFEQISLLKSDSECQVSLENGILRENSCSEKHGFEPFASNQGSALFTELKTNILFVTSFESNELTSQDIYTSKTNLLFDDSYETQKQEEEKDIGIIKEEIESLLKMMSSFPSKSSPSVFASLLRSLRSLSLDNLSNLYDEITESKSRLLDAILLLDNDAGISLVTTLMQKRDLLDYKQIDFWFSNLKYIRKPSRFMIYNLSGFLKKRPRTSAIRGIAALTSNYCKDTSNCLSTPEVFTLLSDFQSILKSLDNFFGQDEEDVLVVTLRALSSLPFSSSLFTPLLKDVLYSPNSSPTLKLMTLMTLGSYNAFSIDETVQEILYKSFKNRKEDSELRIEAYLAAMHRPFPKLLTEIVESLVEEPVNQVGSFVWSHLMNSQEISNSLPLTALREELRSNNDLSNKWSTDPRRFSRYIETSYFSSNFSTGGHFQGGLLFSRDSYIPRSLRLNLTLNIFGQDVNFLDFGGRIEGFESLVESLFNSKGSFKDDALSIFLKSLKRSTRETGSQISRLQGSYNNKMSTQAPSGNYWLKILGSDVSYESFDGLHNLLSKIRPFDNFQNIHFSRSSLFLDGQLIVPTGSGLPLTLSLNGTSLLSLTSHLTSFDVPKILRTGKGILTASIFPSVSVSIVGLMTLKYNSKIQTGIKSSFDFHSRTSLDGSLVLSSNNHLQVILNVPKSRKTEILDVSLNHYSFEDSKGFVPEGIVKFSPTLNHENQISTSFLTSLLGFNLVGFYKNSPQGFGPFSLSLNSEQMDSFSQILFTIQWSKTGKTRMMEFNFDTPGSKTPRHSLIKASWSQETGNLSCILPYRRLQAFGTFQKTNKAFVVEGEFSSDGRHRLKYSQSLQFLKHGLDFTTFIEAQKTVLLNYKGGYRNDVKNKWIQMILKSSWHSEMHFTGNVTENNNQTIGEIQINSKPLFLHLGGSFTIHEKGFSLSGNGVLTPRHQRPQDIAFDSNYNEFQFNRLRRTSYDFYIKSKSYPSLNSEIFWNFQNSKNYVENNLKIKIGEKAYKVSQVFSSQSSEFLLQLSLSASNMKFPYILDIGHQSSSTQYKNKFTLILGKHFKFKIYLNTIRKGFKMMEIEGGMEVFDIKYGLQLSWLQKQREIKGIAILVMNPNNSVSANFTLDILRNGNLNFSGHVQLPQFKVINCLGSLVINASSHSATLALFHDDQILDIKLGFERDENLSRMRASLKTPSLYIDFDFKNTENENTKLLSLDSTIRHESSRHFNMRAELSHFSSFLYPYLSLIIFWDKEQDLSNTWSFSFEARNENDIKAAFDLYNEISGNLALSVSEKANNNNSLLLTGNWSNSQFLKCQISWIFLSHQKFQFSLSGSSSMERMNSFSLILKHWIHESSIWTSDVKLMRNDNDYHYIMIKGHRTEKEDFGQFKIESSLESMNGSFGTLLIKRSTLTKHLFLRISSPFFSPHGHISSLTLNSTQNFLNSMMDSLNVRISKRERHISELNELNENDDSLFVYSHDSYGLHSQLYRYNGSALMNFDIFYPSNFSAMELTLTTSLLSGSKIHFYFLNKVETQRLHFETKYGKRNFLLTAGLMTQKILEFHWTASSLFENNSIFSFFHHFEKREQGNIFGTSTLTLKNSTIWNLYYNEVRRVNDVKINSFFLVSSVSFPLSASFNYSFENDSLLSINFNYLSRQNLSCQILQKASLSFLSLDLNVNNDHLFFLRNSSQITIEGNLAAFGNGKLLLSSKEIQFDFLKTHVFLKGNFESLEKFSGSGVLSYDLDTLPVSFSRNSSSLLLESSSDFRLFASYKNNEEMKGSFQFINTTFFAAGNSSRTLSIQGQSSEGKEIFVELKSYFDTSSLFVRNQNLWSPIQILSLNISLETPSVSFELENQKGTFFLCQFSSQGIFSDFKLLVGNRLNFEVYEDILIRRRGNTLFGESVGNSGPLYGHLELQDRVLLFHLLKSKQNTTNSNSRQENQNSIVEGNLRLEKSVLAGELKTPWSSFPLTLKSQLYDNIFELYLNHGHSSLEVLGEINSRNDSIFGSFSSNFLDTNLSCSVLGKRDEQDNWKGFLTAKLNEYYFSSNLTSHVLGTETKVSLTLYLNSSVFNLRNGSLSLTWNETSFEMKALENDKILFYSNYLIYYNKKGLEGQLSISDSLSLKATYNKDIQKGSKAFSFEWKMKELPPYYIKASQKQNNFEGKAFLPYNQKLLFYLVGPSQSRPWFLSFLLILNSNKVSFDADLVSHKQGHFAAQLMCPDVSSSLNASLGLSFQLTMTKNWEIKAHFNDYFIFDGRFSRTSNFLYLKLGESREVKLSTEPGFSFRLRMNVSQYSIDALIYSDVTSFQDSILKLSVFQNSLSSFNSSSSLLLLGTLISFKFHSDSFESQILTNGSLIFSNYQIHLKYDISANPTGSCLITKNDNEEVFRLSSILVFDGLLPTIILSTNLKGFEKLIVRDEYVVESSSSSSPSLFSFSSFNIYKIIIETKKTDLMKLSFQWNSELFWTQGSYALSLQLPNRSTHQAKLSWKRANPFFYNLSVNDNYRMTGLYDYTSCSLSVKSPWESFDLGAQFKGGFRGFRAKRQATTDALSQYENSSFLTQYSSSNYNKRSIFEIDYDIREPYQNSTISFNFQSGDKVLSLSRHEKGFPILVLKLPKFLSVSLSSEFLFLKGSHETHVLSLNASRNSLSNSFFFNVSSNVFNTSNESFLSLSSLYPQVWRGDLCLCLRSTPCTRLSGQISNEQESRQTFELTWKSFFSASLSLSPFFMSYNLSNPRTASLLIKKKDKLFFVSEFLSENNTFIFKGRSENLYYNARLVYETFETFSFESSTNIEGWLVSQKDILTSNIVTTTHLKREPLALSFSQSNVKAQNESLLTFEVIAQRLSPSLDFEFFFELNGSLRMNSRVLFDAKRHEIKGHGVLECKGNSKIYTGNLSVQSNKISLNLTQNDSPIHQFLTLNLVRDENGIWRGDLKSKMRGYMFNGRYALSRTTGTGSFQLTGNRNFEFLVNYEKINSFSPFSSYTFNLTSKDSFLLNGTISKWTEFQFLPREFDFFLTTNVHSLEMSMSLSHICDLRLYLKRGNNIYFLDLKDRKMKLKLESLLYWTGAVVFERHKMSVFSNLESQSSQVPNYYLNISSDSRIGVQGLFKLNENQVLSFEVSKRSFKLSSNLFSSLIEVSGHFRTLYKNIFDFSCISPLLTIEIHGKMTDSVYSLNVGIERKSRNIFSLSLEINPSSLTFRFLSSFDSYLNVFVDFQPYRLLNCKLSQNNNTVEIFSLKVSQERRALKTIFFLQKLVSLSLIKEGNSWSGEVKGPSFETLAGHGSLNSSSFSSLNLTGVFESQTFGMGEVSFETKGQNWSGVLKSKGVYPFKLTLSWNNKELKVHQTPFIHPWLLCSFTKNENNCQISYNHSSSLTQLTYSNPKRTVSWTTYTFPSSNLSSPNCKFLTSLCQKSKVRELSLFYKGFKNFGVSYNSSLSSYSFFQFPLNFYLTRLGKSLSLTTTIAELINIKSHFDLESKGRFEFEIQEREKGKKNRIKRNYLFSSSSSVFSSSLFSFRNHKVSLRRSFESGGLQLSVKSPFLSRDKRDESSLTLQQNTTSFSLRLSDLLLSEYFWSPILCNGLNFSLELTGNYNFSDARTGSFDFIVKQVNSSSSFRSQGTFEKTFGSLSFKWKDEEMRFEWRKETRNKFFFSFVFNEKFISYSSEWKYSMSPKAFVYFSVIKNNMEEIFDYRELRDSFEIHYSQNESSSFSTAAQGSFFLERDKIFLLNGTLTIENEYENYNWKLILFEGLTNSLHSLESRSKTKNLTLPHTKNDYSHEGILIYNHSDLLLTLDWIINPLGHYHCKLRSRTSDEEQYEKDTENEIEDDENKNDENNDIEYNESHNLSSYFTILNWEMKYLTTGELYSTFDLINICNTTLVFSQENEHIRVLVTYTQEMLLDLEVHSKEKNQTRQETNGALYFKNSNNILESLFIWSKDNFRFNVSLSMSEEKSPFFLVSGSNSRFFETFEYRLIMRQTQIFDLYQIKKTTSSEIVYETHLNLFVLQQNLFHEFVFNKTDKFLSFKSTLTGNEFEFWKCKGSIENGLQIFFELLSPFAPSKLFFSYDPKSHIHLTLFSFLQIKYDTENGGQDFRIQGFILEILDTSSFFLSLSNPISVKAFIKTKIGSLRFKGEYRSLSQFRAHLFLDSSLSSNVSLTLKYTERKELELQGQITGFSSSSSLVLKVDSKKQNETKLTFSIESPFSSYTIRQLLFEGLFSLDNSAFVLSCNDKDFEVTFTLDTKALQGCLKGSHKQQRVFEISLNDESNTSLSEKNDGGPFEGIQNNVKASLPPIKNPFHFVNLSLLRLQANSSIIIKMTSSFEALHNSTLVISYGKEALGFKGVSPLLIFDYESNSDSKSNWFLQEKIGGGQLKINFSCETHFCSGSLQSNYEMLPSGKLIGVYKSSRKECNGTLFYYENDTQGEQKEEIPRFEVMALYRAKEILTSRIIFKGSLLLESNVTINHDTTFLDLRIGNTTLQSQNGFKMTFVMKCKNAVNYSMFENSDQSSSKYNILFFEGSYERNNFSLTSFLHYSNESFRLKINDALCINVSFFSSSKGSFDFSFLKSYIFKFLIQKNSSSLSFPQFDDDDLTLHVFLLLDDILRFNCSMSSQILIHSKNQENDIYNNDTRRNWSLQTHAKSIFFPFSFDLSVSGNSENISFSGIYNERKRIDVFLKSNTSSSVSFILQARLFDANQSVPLLSLNSLFKNYILSLSCNLRRVFSFESNVGFQAKGLFFLRGTLVTSKKHELEMTLNYLVPSTIILVFNAETDTRFGNLKADVLLKRREYSINMDVIWYEWRTKTNFFPLSSSNRSHDFKGTRLLKRELYEFLTFHFERTPIKTNVKGSFSHNNETLSIFYEYYSSFMKLSFSKSQEPLLEIQGNSYNETLSGNFSLNFYSLILSGFLSLDLKALGFTQALLNIKVQECPSSLTRHKRDSENGVSLSFDSSSTFGVIELTSRILGRHGVFLDIHEKGFGVKILSRIFPGGFAYLSGVSESSSSSLRLTANIGNKVFSEMTYTQINSQDFDLQVETYQADHERRRKKEPLYQEKKIPGINIYVDSKTGFMLWSHRSDSNKNRNWLSSLVVSDLMSLTLSLNDSMSYRLTELSFISHSIKVLLIVKEQSLSFLHSKLIFNFSCTQKTPLTHWLFPFTALEIHGTTKEDSENLSISFKGLDNQKILEGSTLLSKHGFHGSVQTLEGVYSVTGTFGKVFTMSLYGPSGLLADVSCQYSSSFFSSSSFHESTLDIKVIAPQNTYFLQFKETGTFSESRAKLELNLRKNEVSLLFGEVRFNFNFTEPLSLELNLENICSLSLGLGESSRKSILVAHGSLFDKSFGVRFEYEFLSFHDFQLLALINVFFLPSFKIQCLNQNFISLSLEASLEQYFNYKFTTFVTPLETLHLFLKFNSYEQNLALDFSFPSALQLVLKAHLPALRSFYLRVYLNSTSQELNFEMKINTRPYLRLYIKPQRHFFLFTLDSTVKLFFQKNREKDIRAELIFYDYDFNLLHSQTVTSLSLSHWIVYFWSSQFDKIHCLLKLQNNNIFEILTEKLKVESSLHHHRLVKLGSWQLRQWSEMQGLRVTQNLSWSSNQRLFLETEIGSDFGKLELKRFPSEESLHVSLIWQPDISFKLRVNKKEKEIFRSELSTKFLSNSKKRFSTLNGSLAFENKEFHSFYLGGEIDNSTDFAESRIKLSFNNEILSLENVKI